MNATQNRPTPARPLTQDELKRKNKDERKKRLQSRPKQGLQSLAIAYDEACREVGVQPEVTKPKPPPRWKGSETGKFVTMEVPGFGSVTVTPRDHHLGELQTNKSVSWSKVSLSGKDKVAVFDITYTVSPGCRLYNFEGTELQEVEPDSSSVFAVNVEWRGPIPCTTNTDDYDVALVFLNEDGEFVQVEVGFTTRSGFPWLSLQEVWAGQVARTTLEKAEKLGVQTLEADGYAVLALPLAPEYNYPGADFLTAGGMAHPIVEVGSELGYCKPLSRCSLPKWAPPEASLPQAMMDEGWEIVVVNFFNLVWGQGFSVCARDGATCHLHNSKILDAGGVPLAKKGEFPFALPMTNLAVKAQDGQKGLSATAIRIL